MGEGEWTALRRVLNDNNQWLPDVCRMLAVFFKWTEVFQSIGVHAGLARQAVREYLAACDPTKQHTPEAREVATALQTLVVEYFATCMDFTPAATAAELDRFLWTPPNCDCRDTRPARLGTPAQGDFGESRQG